jgi:hypothetical protein
MTIEEIEKKVNYVREIAKNDDDESAHWHSDSLHLEFIKYVASLSEQLPELAAKAKLVASTEQIKFSRWYS